MNRFVRLVSVIFLFQQMTFVCFSQEILCNKPVRIYFEFDRASDLITPKDSASLFQYAKISQLQKATLEKLHNNPSFTVIPLPAEVGTAKNSPGYYCAASVSYDEARKQYRFTLDMVTFCNGETVATAAVTFQMYPSWDPVQVASLAVTQLLKQFNMDAFEMNVRETKNYGLGGDIWGGSIKIIMDHDILLKGEQTLVRMTVTDCDNQPLRNKKISTAGTMGGVFTPATFTTDAEGYVHTTFRMTSDKTAIIKAQCETKNVWSCEDLYTGTKVIKGVGGVPVKIEVLYSENSNTSMQRATLPGIKIIGGEETETNFIQHYTLLYHFPTAAMLKEGFLAETSSKDKAAFTMHVLEEGESRFAKSTHAAYITAGPNAMVTAMEPATQSSNSGNPGDTTKSEFTFHLSKGDPNMPSYLFWQVQYPTSNEGLAGGSISIIKGDPGVKWTEKKITDPKSPYKMEYIIEQSLNMAEELKKGNKAMMDMFGFDADKLTGILDPTNPQTGMVGAAGTWGFKVKILSPYAK